jgi:hypothetical protein
MEAKKLEMGRKLTQQPASRCNQSCESTHFAYCFIDIAKGEKAAFRIQLLNIPAVLLLVGTCPLQSI